MNKSQTGPEVQQPIHDVDEPSCPKAQPGAGGAAGAPYTVIDVPAAAPSTSPIDNAFQRLVPLDTWVHENARNRSIWNHGSPRLTAPEGMGKWLKRHEARLTEQGAVIRLGKAWRIVEPTFKPLLFEILTEERARAGQHKGQAK